MSIIEKARQEGRTTLSEHESKQILTAYGIPVTKEILVHTPEDLPKAAEQVGFPLVMKGCSPDVTHKTESSLIRLDVRDLKEAKAAFDDIVGNMAASKGGVLVQEMVKGSRELMVGLTRDPQFGPCVMFGLGGIFTEILKDVSFRLAPLEPRDAREMMREISGHRILDAIRGMEAVDLEKMAGILIAVGQVGVENPLVKEIDVNPLIIRGNSPVAVDALIVLDNNGT